MRERIKKISAWFLLLALLFTYNIPVASAIVFGTAADPVVIDGGDYVSVLDSASDSSGNVHLVAETWNDGTGEVLLTYYKWTATSETWSGKTTLTTQDGPDSFQASIDVDSNGYPGVVWQNRYKSVTTTDINFYKYDGDWDQHYVVASGLDGGSVFDFAFYSDDVAAVVLYDKSDGHNDIDYYEGTTSFSSIEIDGSGGAGAIGVEVVGSSSAGTVHAVQIPAFGQMGDVDYFTSTNGGSSFSVSYDILSTTFSPIQNFERVATSLTSDNKFRFAAYHDTIDDIDSLFFMEKDTGSWSFHTVADGQDWAIPIIGLDTDGTADYLSYFDLSFEDGPVLYLTISEDSFNTRTPVAIDNDFIGDADGASSALVAKGADEMVVMTYVVDGAEENLLDYWYHITEGIPDPPPQGPPPGGEGVPEFSTYVYLLTILTAFSFVYVSNKNNLVNSN